MRRLRPEPQRRAHRPAWSRYASAHAPYDVATRLAAEFVAVCGEVARSLQQLQHSRGTVDSRLVPAQRRGSRPDRRTGIAPSGFGLRVSRAREWVPVLGLTGERPRIATAPLSPGLSRTPARFLAPSQLIALRRDRGGRTRTCDLRFWRPPLYQLSYAPGLRDDCSPESDHACRGVRRDVSEIL